MNFLHGDNAPKGVRGLDRFSWANVPPSHVHYYWVHLVLLLAVVGLICITVYREMSLYVQTRQEYLRLSSKGIDTPSCTILVTDVPYDLLSAERLGTIYGRLPEGVKAIHINRDARDLADKLQERQNILNILELAETNLIRTALKLAKQTRKQDVLQDETPRWTEYVLERNRPTMRLAYESWILSLPKIGAKVDTIRYCRQELARLNTIIDASQRNWDKLPFLSSAIIQFRTNDAVAIACQTVNHHQPFRMRTCAVHGPDDILWQNLPYSHRCRQIRLFVISGCFLILILTWALPIAFTGFLSQITYIAPFSSKLKFLNHLSAALIGFLQGILPQLTLMLLTALLPLAVRTLIEHQKLLTQTAVELTMQRIYFSALFVQIFLTVSLASSATTIVGDIYHRLDSIPIILATNLPKSSNYFFSYLLLQALSISSTQLLQIMSLIRWILVTFLQRDHTPRQTWLSRESAPVQIQWGTLFPIFTNLACIGR